MEEHRNKRRKAELLKRWIALLLVMCMMFSDSRIGNLVAYAEESQGQQEQQELQESQEQQESQEPQEQQASQQGQRALSAPEVKVFLTKIEGGETLPGQPMTFLNDGTEMIMDVTIAAGFQQGEAKNLCMNVELPYLYKDGNTVISTTDIDTVPSTQKDKNGNPLMGVQARIITYNDFDCEGQHEDTNKSFKGLITLEKDGGVLSSGSPQVVRMAVSFYGEVPENTSAVIRSGGAYGFYQLNTEKSDTGYTVMPGDSENSSYTIINSNLKWEMSVEQVGRQTMWDKYNYMTYKVTMKNVSESEKSYFDSFAINFQPPSHEQTDYGEGLLDKDAMTWIYDEEHPDKPIENLVPSVEDDQYYVGVPEKGGVLVYEVTGKNQAELDKWNLETYDNVTEPVLCYSYTNNRMISIWVNDGKEIKTGESREYYIAVPFTNNFLESTEYKVPTYFTPTIYLGTSIQWSKAYNFEGQFDAPVPGFTHEKYVLDASGNKADNVNIPIEGKGIYYISGFENTGNLPAFNAKVNDTLPENFDIQKVTIRMNEDAEDSSYVPKLKDWFDTSGILEFGFADENGETIWVNSGKFVKNSEATGGKEWSIDVKGFVKNYLKDHDGHTFTRKIRINLKERIEKTAKFDGYIAVEGVAEKVSELTNRIVTNYDEKLWAPSTTETGEQYYKLPQTVAEDTAQLTAVPADPLLEVVGYRTRADGSYVYGGPTSAGKDTLTIPLKREGVGFRYNLGNGSISPGKPFILKSGKILPLSGNKGIVLDKVLLSKHLLEVSEISYVRLISSSGQKLNVTDISNKDTDGNSVIDRAVWENTLSDVSNVEIYFESFYPNVTLSDDAYVMLDGKANAIGTINVEGSLETKYDSTVYDKVTKDPSALISDTIYPSLEAKSYDELQNFSGINTQNTDSKYINSMTAAKGVDGTGYVFHVSNKSESGTGETNIWIKFRDTEKKESKIEGFLLKNLYLSANLADFGIVKEIQFFDYDQDETAAGTTPILTIDWANVEQDADGRWHVKENQIAAAGAKKIKTVKIVFDEISGQNDTSNPAKLEIQADGNSDSWSRMDAVIRFEPLDETMSDKAMSAVGRLYTYEPSLSVNAYSYDENQDPTANSSRNYPSSSYINHLEVANSADHTGYVFDIANSSRSGAGETSIEVNFPNTKVVNDTSKGDAPILRGFLLKNMYFSANLDQVAKIKEIQFFDYDDLNDPILTLSGKTDLNILPDGTYQIAEETINSVSAARIKKVKIVFENLLGQSNPSSLEVLSIKFDGNSNQWGTIDATMNLKTLDPLMVKTASVTGRLIVREPNPALQAYSYDGSVTPTAKSSTNTSSSSTIHSLSVPYQKENTGFVFRIGNYSYSRTDETNVRIEFVNTGVKNNTSTGDAEIVKGFDLKDLYFSQNVEELGEIETISLYYYNPNGLPEIALLDWTSVTKLSDGRYQIDETRLKRADGLKLNKIILHFKDIYGSKTPSNPEWIDIQLNGNSDQWDNIDAVMKLETVDPLMKKTANVTGRLSVEDPNLVLKGSSYNNNTSQKSSENTNTNGTNYSLTVPNKVDNTGYVFKITNNSRSDAGSTEVLVDLPETGVKNDTTLSDATAIVKGFHIKDMVFTNLDAVGEIDHIDFYDYDQDPTDKSVVPKYTIDGSNITLGVDGKYHIPESAITGITRVKSFKIAFKNIKGQADMNNQQTLELQLDGNSDWFLDLNANMTAELLDKTMYQWVESRRIHQVKARLHIDKPSLMVHSNILYYDVTETSHSSSNSSDGYATRLGIPYDRDFRFRVSIENTSISILDDVEMEVTLPINAKDGSAEENTGFHTTKVLLKKELIQQFAEFESVTFYDRNKMDGVTYQYDKDANTLYIEESGSRNELPKNAEGDWEFTMTDIGIDSLYQVFFTGDLVKVKDESTVNAWMDFYGFMDSDFETDKTITVSADNYLDGIRDERFLAEYKMHTQDSSIATVSKMYFDIVSAAAYKDVEASISSSPETTRFDQTSSALEHVREDRRCNGGWHHSTHYFLDDSELDIGYKAIGSYTLDFRQYLNVGTNYPVDYPTEHSNSYDSQEHQSMNWIKTQSFNTAANVEMTMTLPDDYFDAYYVKVRPDAIPYLNSITVYWKDGTSNTYTDWSSKSSIETYNDEEYYVIPIAELANDTTDKYRSPYGVGSANYEDGVNMVSKVVFNVTVNKDASETITNSDGTTTEKAKNPDMGTGYQAQNDSTKFQFEVTGRFYKHTETTNTERAEAKVTSTITVGDGVRSKQRTDSSVTHNNTTDKNRSKWSYWNTYTNAKTSKNAYDAGHLVTTARVHVQNDNNRVLKGVHDSPGTDADDGVKGGSHQYYAVAFYRQNQLVAHDYEGGTDVDGTKKNWIYQDPDDWSGKISFADEVYLEDTLPYIANDDDSEYVGFRTSDILFGEELYKYISRVEFTLSNGTKVTKEKKDLQVSGTSGYYEVLLKYEEKGESATAENEILLPAKTFLSSYKVVLKDLPGSADYARELYGREGLQTADSHGGTGTVDIKVGGYVHTVKNVHEDSKGTNTIAASFQNDDMETPETRCRYSSSSWAVSQDTGRLMGYQIPFTAGWKIEKISTDSPEYDYESDNKTPNVTSFGGKLWNRPDVDTEKNESARLKSATATSTLPDAFNLKTVNIPIELIDGTWFKATQIKLNYNGKSKTFSLDPVSNAYLTKDISKEYYTFDVNKFIRENLSEFATETYMGTTYYKEHIDSFVLDYSAVTVDLNDSSTLLDGGEYISEDKQEGYAFTYDGVWVNRTEDDIKNDADTVNSRPSFGREVNSSSTNAYNSSTVKNELKAEFTAADMNAKPKSQFVQAAGTVGSITYSIRNLVGQMVVHLERGEENASNLAYDRQVDALASTGINTVEEAETDIDTTVSTTRTYDVDNKHLLPYDYVDYTLTLGAAESSPIPLQHSDMKFVVPEGQRILGWEVKTNTISSVENKDITATVNDGSELVISLGANGTTVDRDMIQPGEKVEILVHTQFTKEITDFEGKAVTSSYTAVSRPKHTYSQYSILALTDADSIAGNTTSYGTGNNYYTEDRPSTNASVYYRRYYTTFYEDVPESSDWTSVVSNKLTFFEMNHELKMTYEFTDPTAQYDRKGMVLKLMNKNSTAITNDTQHTLKDVTFEVSFMTPVKTSSGETKYFKSFELTEMPQFKYPVNVENKDAKAEFWYCVDDENGDEVWIKEEKVAEGTVSEEENGKYSVTEVKKIRWIYHDIPEMGNDGNEVVFATADEPFVFNGLGLYNDIRESKNVEIADRYTMKLDAKMDMVHEHVNEQDDPSVDTVEFTKSAEITRSIARERPIVTYQTQIFENSEQAAAAYTYDAVQKKAYRPGDVMWYKVTVKNQKLTESNATRGMQGPLRDPVFYDKIPEYVSADMSQIQIRWLDADGKEKENAPELKVSAPTTMNAPDYGGDMVTDKNTASEGAGGGSDQGNKTGYYFTDVVPTAANSTNINYQVYEFGFEEGTYLDVGEQIEIWYPVTVRQENLPMNYVKDRSGNVYPEYYPKIGSYYQLAFSASYSNSNSNNGTSWPLGNGTRSDSIADGHLRNITNSSIMMDMNYLIHDVGVSGSLNKNIDRWEFLKESTTYIPGTSSNNPSSGSHTAYMYGNNGRYLDMDSAADSIYQAVVYTPSHSDDNSDLDELPVSIKYNKYGESASRDVYEKIVKPRSNVIETAWDNISGEEKHIPILWSEARSHLQTAWIATSSEIIPDHEAGETTTDYANHAKQYLKNAYTYCTGYGVTNPNYSVYVSDDYGQQARHRFLPDDYVPTIEYDESYTARLSAYNYGDWGVDGVEFIYVLPRGISPEKDSDGNFKISGNTLTSGNSNSSIDSGAYTAIDSSNITVEVLQNPNDTQSYLSPKSIQDPILSTAAWNTTSDVYDEQYYSQADSQSWVLKITVKQPLKKWFNRGAEKGYILHVDVRCHVDSNNESEYWYDKVFTRPIEVEGVGSNNDSAFYQIYDITSWDGDTKDKATQAHGSLSVQFAGMDYLWDGYDDYYAVDGATAYNSGSPNMPYINGFNIQNNEVFVNENVNGTVAAGDLHDHYATGNTGTYASTGTRAQMRKPLVRTWTTFGNILNGSKLEKYYINTEGEQSTVNIHLENKYYWNDQSTYGHKNIPSDNYDNNSYLRHKHNYSTDGGNEGTLFFPVVTNILPAGTVPMYKDGDGKLKIFTTDNTENAKHTVDWTLYDGSGNALSEEQTLYTAKVEYVEITNENGHKEGRYKVMIYQDQNTKGDQEDAKILSGNKRIFSVHMITVQEPDMSVTKVAGQTKAPDLLLQYQTDRTYVTSQLKSYKFKIDGDISGNPYYVGAYWYPYYSERYNTGDSTRTDSVRSRKKVPLYYSSISYVTGGVLPASNITILENLINGADGLTYSINDTVGKGIRRYYETKDNTEEDIFQLEDYPEIRETLPLSDVQRDFNQNTANTHVDAAEDGAFADMGAYASMRIRTQFPRMGVLSYVSDKIEEIGGRDTTEGDAVIHYPTPQFDNKGYKKTDADHKQYGDYLYYTAKISNKPSSNVAYEEMGDVHHAKIILSVVLPETVSYEEEYYIEKEIDGQTVRYSMTELAEAGWKIKLRSHVVDDDTKEETLVFEIITPGETTSYEEYLQGKHVAGYFASGDEFDFKVKTVIDRLGSAGSVLDTPDYWDDQYYADMYVTLEDTEGTFTGIEGLTKQSLEKASFVNEVKDTEASDEKDAVDYDLDGDYEERYASDRSARFTILKPSATVRLDTSIKRVQLNNPDAGIIIAEDASIKGATISQVYLDQAVNTGGAVGEFIVDYRVPHRATTTGTIYEADMSSPQVLTTIEKIRTGVWEVPETAKDYEELCERLKVNVYVRLSDEPEKITYDNPGDYNEYANEEGWQSLGSFGLKDNKEISIKKEWQLQVKQIRFVIKADDSTDHADETQKYPVPQGFRLDIDANTNTPDVKEEMDDIDPMRTNIEFEEDKRKPNNVEQNAAFVQLSIKHKEITSMKLHANNFATAWGRYDDVQYAALSKAARAGYFINVELPVIQKDLIPYYFYRYSYKDENDKNKYAFKWSDNQLMIQEDFSKMLKFTSVIKNLSNEEIANTTIKEKEDNASYPTISVVLPYIQDMDDNHFEYVDAYSSAYEDSYVNTAYESTERIEKEQAQWTYYVMDQDGNKVRNSNITGYKFKTYEKKVDLSGNARKVLTWEFEGFLKPGETIVVEYMVPISTKDYGIVSSDLLKCASYGYLKGSFKHYIPESKNINETYSVEVDARDINDNGKTINETALIKRVGGITFNSKRVINQLKYSYSEYDTTGLQIKRPALVPEGTDYSFKVMALDPDGFGKIGFKKTILYDVLPYNNDKAIANVNSNDATQAADRNSTWSGWLLPDSLKVKLMKTSNTDTETTVLKDGEDCQIWVGPFTKDASGKIIAGEISDLPEYAQTSKTEFYQNAYKSEEVKRNYFVRLSEIQALETVSPSEYLELSKKIGAIWVQMEENDKIQLDGGVKYELTYNLHAPLNLPQYPGVITDDMTDDTIRENVKDYTGWNTFAVQATEATEAETSRTVTESPQAGVYLNAPAEKGYIGSYVWYDENYNMTEDEGEYERRSDGRLIFKNATKDLDFDGQPDDPGINNVLVELLTENGYPANKLGEAVVEVEENGVTKYILIDEETGLKAQDANGTYLYTTEGPATYTTEADAYGNNGYFVISNVTPGNYKLRYTLPEGTYNKYAVTTLEIGTTNTAMDIYRPGDTLPDLGNAGTGDTASDAMAVTNNLIVQTRDSIQIDAIGTDPSTYPAYDEKMTSYNVGVSKSYVYGGYAWVDESDDGSGNITSDGIYDRQKEDSLENVEVTFYEVVDGELKKAKDVNGDRAECKTDANGYFEIYLYPNRTYVARTSTANTNDIYKPSPITINTDPLAAKDDNDLTQTADKKQETFLFSTGIKYDEAGTPIMTDDGNYGLYDYIGLGYVHSGRGFIGKYIWDDKNYDGIRNSYVSDGTSKNEPGIANVTLILEKYYYYDREWVPVPDENQTITSNRGGSYTFQNVSASYMRTDPDTGQTTPCLTGYKVKVDMDSFPSDYVITKYQMNGGADDSDLPVNATNTDSYLTAGAKDTDPTGKYIIIAEDAADSSQSDYIYDLGDKSYDMATAKMILDLDLGLTFKEAGEISGKIWEDKTYDGLQNTYQADEATVEEPGIADVELEAVQYYYKDNNWVQNPNYGSPSIMTDADGNYQIAGQETYVTVDGVKYLAGYKVRVKAIDGKYAVTKYRVGTDTTIDSDLVDENLYLTADEEYLILAKDIADADYAGNTEYIITNDLGNFDINKAVNTGDHDGGLVEYQKADLYGCIWEDRNYNGIFDAEEAGIENTSLTLVKYYLDEDENWQKVPDWTVRTMNSGAGGAYRFEDLDAHAVVDGKHYLAGYRVEVEKDSAPDKERYGITLYRVGTTGERDSDLTDGYEIYHGTGTNGYSLIAAPAAGNVLNTPYLREVDGVVYDYVTAVDAQDNDGGFTAYKTSDIKGTIFEDVDYDGFLDSEEGFTELLSALAGEDLIVTKETYYYGPEFNENHDAEVMPINDAENGAQEEEMAWHPYKHQNADGEWEWQTETTIVNSDGTYEFKDVPTQVYVKTEVDNADGTVTEIGTHYLAGYRLKLSRIPNGFGTTLYLVNDGSVDSSLYYEAAEEEKAEVLDITKTHPVNGYNGTHGEEMDGYLIMASPASAGETYAVVKGYDLLRSRDLTEYNAGFHKDGEGMIEGTVFHDMDYDGIYEKDPEEGINGVTVYLDQYYLTKGGWKKVELAEDEDAYAQTETTTVNGEDGIFVFDKLPAKVTVNGTDYLAAYRIHIDEIPDGYAVTKLNQRTGEGEALDETRDSDMVAENGELLLGDGSDPLDGYIVLAKPLEEGAIRNEEYIREYNGTEFDLQESVIVNDYDAGLTDFQGGSIGGTIWMDQSDKRENCYNGIQDEGEKGIEGQKVFLTQYVYKDGLLGGSWEKVEDFGTDGQKEAVTDENGDYLFKNLPVFRVNEDGKRELFSYQLQVEELMDGYAVTKYRQGEDRTVDSDLNVETLGLTEEDEFIILAKDVTEDTYRNEAYVEAVKIGFLGKTFYYDIVVGEHNREYDGGYTPYLPGNISGLIWLDYREDAEDKNTNYNGIQDEGEIGIEGQKVLLSQYALVENEWVQVEDFGTDGVLESVTDADGAYHFDNLPTFRKTEEGRELLSYRLKVEELMEGYAVTRYRQGEDVAADSDLEANTLELTTEEEYLILAKDVTEMDYRNEFYVLKWKTGLLNARYYDIAEGINQTDYDGGYTEYPLGSISGIAFEDGNRDGIYEESADTLKPEMTIYLKKYYYDAENKIWQEMSEGFDAKTTTDKDGHYCFDKLPTYVKVEAQLSLVGYKLYLKEVPEGYEVADYQKNNGTNDSALLEENLEIMKKDGSLKELMDGYILVAGNNKDEKDRNLINTIGDYDIAIAMDREQYNVGFTKVVPKKPTGGQPGKTPTEPEKPSKDSNVSANTGDHTLMIIWLFVLLMSGSVLPYVIIRKRKKMTDSK